MLREKLRMVYQVPTASGNWSDERVFETQDGHEWERAVNVAHEEGYKIVKVERIKEGSGSTKYYSTQRPVDIGTYPKTQRVVEIVNFDERVMVEEIGRPAWGYIEYAEPITEQEASNYELVAAR